jgi:hypothetical protein
VRALALVLGVLAVACQPVGGSGDPAEPPDEHTAAAAENAMSGGGPMPEDLHLRLTTLRPAAAGDSARAARVLAQMRSDLARYRDIRVALEDGFRQYVPSGAAPVQHYTKLRWAFRARNELDPSRPTSLLYRRGADGKSLELVGAMFTAPPDASEDELNARLPLSVTRWHQHINWCTPPLRGARRRWRETKDGRPVFGPRSPIASREACDAVGGRFHARLLGWMVHVLAFQSDDPAVVWGVAGGHAHAH